MSLPYTDRPVLRSQRLNQLTQVAHDELEHAVKAQHPFASPAHYARFLSALYLFQAELEPCYLDTQLGQIIPNLPCRWRMEQAGADLADLNTALPEAVSGALTQISVAQGLGWLFVSEGSKLGAAALLKRVAILGLNEQYGARFLAEPEGGRAEGWKGFVRVLDSLPFDAQQEAELDAAAVAAFERVRLLLQHCFASANSAA